MQEPTHFSRNQPAPRNGFHRHLYPLPHCVTHARQSGHARCQRKTWHFKLCNSAMHAATPSRAEAGAEFELGSGGVLCGAAQARGLLAEIHRQLNDVPAWNVTSARYGLSGTERLLAAFTSVVTSCNLHMRAKDDKIQHLTCLLLLSAPASAGFAGCESAAASRLGQDGQCPWSRRTRRIVSGVSLRLL